MTAPMPRLAVNAVSEASGGGRTVYPFSAVCGMDDAKRALLCAAVNPNIRTVLVRGPSGTAKTVLARSLGPLVGRDVVNVPLNVTEEQLFGGMDMDAAVREGKAVLERGLLSRADGCILYLDDANLVDRRLLASLLDCVLRGKVLVERDGISAEYGLDTLMVATMNPEHSDLSPHLLDRFDLCASVPAGDMGLREEVLRRNMEFDRDPAGFVSRFSRDEESLRGSVASADVGSVEITDSLLAVAAGISGAVDADGFRGEIALVNAAAALAALDGRTEVTRTDVSGAAAVAMVHRVRAIPEDSGSEFVRTEDEHRGSETERSGSPAVFREGVPEDLGSERLPRGSADRKVVMQIVREVVFEIGEQFDVIDLFDGGISRVRRTSSRKGGRALVESSDGTGRYARSRMPRGEVADVAFDATVRAAAPYQRGREHGDTAITVEDQDIRLKVRERRAGCTIMFLVDSSGSLGISNRMSAVKGAVLSMLRDSYVKRDRIGMMVFRQDRTELVLPPTKSVEYSYRMLEKLPTGGKTPLGDALITVRDYMTSYSGMHPGEDCHVVIITDGIGNVPVRKGADPDKEVLAIASSISIPQVRWIIIDTSSGLTTVRYAERLADALGARHLRLKDLNANNLAEAVRDAVRD